MQLRKVCNHPDLFEVRPIVTSFAMPRSIPSYYQSTNELVKRLFNKDETVSFQALNLDVTGCENMNYFVCQSTGKLMTTEPFQDQINKLKFCLSNLRIQILSIMLVIINGFEEKNRQK